MFGHWYHRAENACKQSEFEVDFGRQFLLSKISNMSSVCLNRIWLSLVALKSLTYILCETKHSVVD